MKWVSTFKYLKIGYGEDIAQADDITQRVSFDNNVNADKVRIRFSNRYSRNELRIEKATIGKADSSSDISVITLDGSQTISLAPGKERFSDEIDYRISAGDRITINIYYKDRQCMDSICCFWADGGTEVDYFDGDMTEPDAQNTGVAKGSLPEITSQVLKEDVNIGMMRMFSGFDVVQAYTGDDTEVIAAFGDSITHMSFYTNALQKRLYEAYPGKVSLINCGIGGNRLVDDATFAKTLGKRLVLFGNSGVSRFDEDVFELDQVHAVMSLIGINDIMHPLFLEEKEDPVSADAIIEGLQKIVSFAHDRGTKIFLGTITPCGNDEYPKWWLPKFETVRQAVNEWIRQNECSDGFYDFDAALRDNDKNGYLIPDYEIGDGLHPNIPGGKKMADLVDLKAVVD